MGSEESTTTNGGSIRGRPTRLPPAEYSPSKEVAFRAVFGSSNSSGGKAARRRRTNMVKNSLENRHLPGPSSRLSKVSSPDDDNQTDEEEADQ